MPRDRIKLLIVDDHPVFREGLRQCLEASEFHVLGAVGGGEDMWRALRACGNPLGSSSPIIPGTPGAAQPTPAHGWYAEITG